MASLPPFYFPPSATSCFYIHMTNLCTVLLGAFVMLEEYNKYFFS